MAEIPIDEYDNGYVHVLNAESPMPYLASAYCGIQDDHAVVYTTRETFHGHNKKFARILGENIDSQTAKRECLQTLKELLEKDTMDKQGDLVVSSVKTGTVEDRLFPKDVVAERVIKLMAQRQFLP
jgi:hypothetical protein